jgi:hypothetical protein
VTTAIALKMCSRCVLPETFPGIKFDEDGVCNYCHRAMTEEKRATHRADARARFEQLLEEVRGKGSYDVLVGWSGGKDSTYILARLLEEFKVRVLAFTFDNGFVSKQAFRNMEKLSDSLGIDHIIYKANLGVMKTVFNASAEGDEIYPKSALGRASNICTSCMGLAKSMALRICIEKNIAGTGAPRVGHLQEQPANDPQDAGGQRRPAPQAGWRRRGARLLFGGRALREARAFPL